MPSQAEPILDTVRRRCADSPTTWSVDIDTTEFWVYAEPDGVILPSQGWKLHVSAGAASAERVLDRALDVLAGDDSPTAFKVARSAALLDSLNWGLSGLSQIGKFITVYPTDDAQAVRLADALHDATVGERGPRVPSDRPLVPGSLVHYRYGSFTSRYGRLASGDVAPVIEDPTGDAMPDRRRLETPEWVTDPFATEARVPPPGRSRVVGDRFVLAGTMAQTARGSVYVAVDLEGPDRCVVKHARRDALLQSTDTDARDRLRAEAATLARLGEGPWPTLLALVDDGDDVFLAEDEIRGQPLWHALAALAATGRHLPEIEITRLGVELAGALQQIHDHGLVVRDLKAPNVIIDSDERVRLIDLECQALGSDTGHYALATRGYCSPQQRGREPAAVADDVFSLGALLWFMATGADPSAAPDPTNLLQRSVPAMRPDLSPALVDVIATCLADSTDERYPTASDVVAALGRTASHHPVPAATPRAPGPVPQPDGRRGGPADRAAWDERVDHLARILVQRARHAPTGGITWKGRSGPHLSDLGAGDAGVVLALAAVASCRPEDHDRLADTIAAGAAGLLHAPDLEGTSHGGLLVGGLGPAVALLAVGTVLDDTELVEAACERARRAAAMPENGVDLARGSAGRIRAFGWFEQATGDTTWVDAARVGADHLLATADHDDTGCWWTTGGGAAAVGDRRVGYLDGAAGIADSLLDLAVVTGEERHLEVARDAMRWIVAQAVPASDDDRGITWPTVAGEAPALLAWCTGATGVGTFLLHASDRSLADDLDLAAVLPATIHPDIAPTLDGLARAAATTVATGTRSLGPSRCHGLAGSIDLCLDVADTAEAFALADLLGIYLAVARGDEAQPSPAIEAPLDLANGYLEGWSGILATAARLARPDTPDLLGPRWWFNAVTDRAARPDGRWSAYWASEASRRLEQ